MAACNRKGCDMPAKWRVGCRLWAVGYHKKHSPAEVEIGLVVCDHHKADPGTVGEFFIPDARLGMTRL